jgi:hypothetical protein
LTHTAEKLIIVAPMVVRHMALSEYGLGSPAMMTVIVSLLMGEWVDGSVAAGLPLKAT